MEKRNKVLGIIVIIAVVVFLLIFIGMKVVEDAGKSQTQITVEDTVESLKRYVDKKVQLKIKDDPIKGTVDLESSSLEDELPSIDIYPFKVKGTGDIDIEIFSSPEKAGDENSNGDDKKANTWLIEVVKNFNRAGYTVNGKTVSVSLRSVSSGIMVDYISSGVYIPDGITPSNEDWPSMLKAKGVTLNQEAESLVQNTAGIVVQKAVYDRIIEEYGSVNINTVIEATVNGKLAMGYTNPYASSTGLNFLVTSLYCFDSTNPLSHDAIAGFQSFQANVPVVSYNTVQMQGAINSGVLEGMILEYQTYVNTPELRNYEFVPFGVRHDNPLYSIGTLSEEKKEAFKLFSEFATNEEAKESAKNYGFGGNAGYVSEVPTSSGNILLDAQQLWKDKKDGDQEIVAVFIVDTSGSVDGAPLKEMKESLINAGQYIKPDAYVGLVSYSSSVTINLPIAQFDLNQRAYFNGEINSFTAGGGTATFDAIAVGLQMLEEARAKHSDAKFMLFVLSDGNSDGSINSVRNFIENLKVPVYTIGYNANIEALKEISKINEAASINADTEDIIYKLKSLFNAEM